QAQEQAAREQGDWSAVAQLLERRAAGETDSARQAGLRLELAGLYGEKLGRPGDALRFLEHAAKLVPNDVHVQERLGDLLFSGGRGGEAEPIYRRLADKARSARRMKDVARFQQRLGALRESSGDLVEALKSYEEAYKVDPT